MPDDTGTIWVEDEGLRPGFTQMPNALLGRTDVPAGAKLVYLGLLSYAWQEESCYPGQKALAERVGLSPRSVFTHLQQLQAAGLLAVERRGQGMTNVYTLKRLPNLIRKSCDPGIAKSADPESQGLRGKKTQFKKTQRAVSRSHPDWVYATDTPRAWRQTWTPAEGDQRKLPG